MFKNKDALIKEVEIYTSKSSIKEWNKSVWFAKIIEDGKETIREGVTDVGTYNTIELVAIIEALKKANEQAKCIIYTKNDYILKTISNNWLKKWENRDWIKRVDGLPVKNKKLWQELNELLKVRTVEFRKYQGTCWTF